MRHEKVSYFSILGKLNNLKSTKSLNKRLIILKFLQKRWHLLSKFFSCNQTASIGFSSGAFGANIPLLSDSEKWG